MAKRKRGKFIVIEGLDGAGKATQTRLLLQRLRQAGRRTGTLDFPQYNQTFFGEMCGRFLTGKYGQAIKIHPYFASLPYALDRWQAKSRLDRWLAEGRVVVSNRFTSSSAIHQGGKIYNRAERRRFWAWLYKMEYGIFGLPKPNKIIFLDTPTGIGRRLVMKKGKRGYVGHGRDQAETSIKHQRDASAAARDFGRFVHWTRVPSTNKGRLDTPAAISGRVWAAVKPIIGLR